MQKKGLGLFCILLTFPLLFSCYKADKKDVKVFFYKLETHYIDAIKILLDNKFSNGEMNLIFGELKDDDHIKGMAKEEKGSILIFSKKRELPFSTSILQSFSDEVYDKLSLDIKKYGKINFPKRYMFSLPLLVEPYYLIVKQGMDIRYFDISMNTSIYNEDEFKNECKDGYPIMVNGGDDEALFLFLLFCMQSIKDSKEQKDEMVKKTDTERKMSPEEKIEMLNIIHNPKILHDSLKNILTLQKKGAFHPEWFRLKKEDMKLFLELSEVGMAFVARSEYQKMLKMDSFSYSLIDSSLLSSPYPVPLSMIYLFEIEKEIYADGDKTPIKMIEEYLISQNGQKELGEATSLLPSTFNDENIKDKKEIFIIEDETSLKLEKTRDLPSLLKDVRQYFYVCGMGY